MIRHAIIFLMLLGMLPAMVACEQLGAMSEVETTGSALDKVILDFTRQPGQEEPGEQRVVIAMASEQEYKCFNYRVVYQLAKSGETLDLYVKGAQRAGEMCLPAFGPARAAEEVGLSQGTYTLRVHLRGTTDVYSLVVNDSEIEVNPIGTPQISQVGEKRLLLQEYIEEQP